MSFIKSGSIMAGSSFAAMALQVLTLSLYAARLPESELTAYFMVTAAAVLISPFIRLGMNDSILYYVGRNRDDNIKNFQILMTALAFYGVVITIGAFLILLLPEMFALVLFSDSNDSNLVLLALLLGTSRSTYDAFLRYQTAIGGGLSPGIHQLIVMGLYPLLVVVVGRPLDVYWLILQTAVGTYLIWISFFVFTCVRQRKLGIAAFCPKFAHLKPMLQYGVGRVPTVLGLSCLLSGPVLIADRLDLPAADIIVIGGCMTLLRMFSIANQVMTYVMLPRISWAHANRPDLLVDVVTAVFTFASMVGFVVCAGLVATGDTVLR